MHVSICCNMSMWIYTALHAVTAVSFDDCSCAANANIFVISLPGLSTTEHCKFNRKYFMTYCIISIPGDWTTPYRWEILCLLKLNSLASDKLSNGRYSERILKAFYHWRSIVNSLISYDNVQSERQEVRCGEMVLKLCWRNWCNLRHTRQARDTQSFFQI